MFGDETFGREALQHAAQVTRIQTELLSELRRRRVLALRKLVKDPTFGQRQRAAEQSCFQDPDLAGVEPIEPPDGPDPLFQL
jgi:hypothetical protein